MIVDLINKFVAGEIPFGDGINYRFSNPSNPGPVGLAEAFDAENPGSGLATEDFAAAGITGAKIAVGAITAAKINNQEVFGKHWMAGAIINEKFIQAGTTISEDNLNTNNDVGGADVNLYPNILRVPAWTGGDTKKLVLAAGYYFAIPGDDVHYVNITDENMLGGNPNFDSVTNMTILVGVQIESASTTVYPSIVGIDFVTTNSFTIAVSYGSPPRTFNANFGWFIIGWQNR